MQISKNELAPGGYFALEYSQYSDERGLCPFHISPLTDAVSANLSDFFNNDRADNKWQVVYIGASLEECNEAMRNFNLLRDAARIATETASRPWYRISERLPKNMQRVEITDSEGYDSVVNFFLNNNRPIWVTDHNEMTYPTFWRPTQELIIKENKDPE